MAKQRLQKSSSSRSDCPISTALEYIGDKWTLLLVRDIGMYGKHRNKDFQQGREGIPSNVLASRLKTMVENGLLLKRRYQEHPPRYEYHLTKAGERLLPVVREMARWAASSVEGISLPKGN